MSLSNNFPTIRPTLLLDFANTKQLDPRITFTRASTATYYDGKTTAMAEQNLLQYSQDFDNAAWTKYQSTVTANAIASPDGTTTADKVIATAVSGSHVVYQLAGTNGVQQVVSVYAKAAEYTNLQICLNGAGSANAVFDLTAVTATNVIGTTASIISVGNGWYRCVAVMTQQANNAVGIQGFPTGATANNFGNIFTGDGTSGIYLWGAQVEQRSSVTAYTATTTAPITNYIPVLQTAASGVARFDNNPTTGESLGLLIEEQRTNLLTYSEQLNNAAWTTYGSVTVSPNTVVSPDGALTADTVIPSASTGTFGIGQSYTKAASAITYTLSGFSKVAGYDYLILRIDSGGANGVKGAFNIATATVSTAFTTNGTGYAIVGSSINSVGNGWVRWSVTFTTDTGTLLRPIVYVSNATGDGYSAPSFAANGYSGVYIWGAQLEAGAFATSYIPTTSAQVTRAADAASMTGTNFSSWFNAGAGSMYTEFEMYATTTASGMTPAYADSGSANGYGFYKGGSSATLYAYEGSTNANLGNITAGTFAKAIMAYDSAGVAGSLNAAAVVSSSASYPVTPIQIGFGKNWGGNQMSGHIKKFAYYPVRLQNSQLQALTS